MGTNLAAKGMSLSVKNARPALVEILKIRAKEHHRSLQGEVMDILEKAAAEPEPKGYDFLAAFERIKARGLRTNADSARWIREDRDAR